MKMDTYINFGGNCAEAFRFYEQHLGAKVKFTMKWGDCRTRTSTRLPATATRCCTAPWRLAALFC